MPQLSNHPTTGCLIPITTSSHLFYTATSMLRMPRLYHHKVLLLSSISTLARSSPSCFVHCLTLSLLTLPLLLSFHNLQCLTILQANCKSGLDMTIADFCKIFELGEGIKEKLQEHSYTHAHMLRFITLEELKEMWFKFREIAGLQDAIKCGSVVT
jgi:hypothetical protein